ncbi:MULTISPECIES: acyl-CoA dehydrogenase family protein [unclassified Pseudofrankia]|uniref:acyl-CoA dehydrogenase family protein n=1 Tax=unclassified Pseudofrankia TaxID=2994372 RepID=UPI0008D8DCCD|nr:MULTISPECIES: acyl-CoA dehydrogenase [unclassified Pseudofrankia]MDT3444074.1 acyl-CoA dehydrogenase [Pseudofrankia sp. BMG5.37]OHV65295.1 acyl-CoA dehydrogenase [Pseudofrankia sp. BMG5.36]
MLSEFDEDQRLWRSTVRDVLAKECTPALVRGAADAAADTGGPGGQRGCENDLYSHPRRHMPLEALWQTYTNLGWTQLVDPSEMVELAILVEELGRATDPTPFLATMTQFVPLAPGVAGAKQSGAALPEGITARRDGDGWLLDGTARHVLDGDRADWLAVVTTEGVFAIPAAQASVTRVPVFDPVLHVAEVALADVRVGGDNLTGADPEKARHQALTGMATTMVGACQRVLDLVIEHVRTRQQFGAPIGSFQAVKHKAADMHVAIERARALAYFAALTIAADDPRRRLAASMAKASAGECQSLVFRHGLQLFGGMGYTWENDLQFALKRAKAGEVLLGTADEHRALIAKENLTLAGVDSRAAHV